LHSAIACSRLNLKPNFLKVKHSNNETLLLFKSGAFVVTGLKRESQIARSILRFVRLLNTAGLVNDLNFCVAPFEEYRIKTVLGIARLPFICPPPEKIVTRWTFDAFARLEYNSEIQTYLTIREVTSEHRTSVNLFTRTGRMVVFGKNISGMRRFIRYLAFILHGIIRVF
jgi:hypothetical protein